MTSEWRVVSITTKTTRKGEDIVIVMKSMFFMREQFYSFVQIYTNFATDRTSFRAQGVV